MKPPQAVDTVLKTVGRTPLVRLERLEPASGVRLYAKCEYLGPGGSIFDRAALAEIDAAERTGRLGEGRALFAAGGSDAILSLALVASAKGHPFTAVVPRSLHPERRRALADYGARTVSVDDALGYDGAQAHAVGLAKEQQGLFVNPFEGAESVAACEAIGREIVEALEHAPTVTFVGMDLGAIPTGVARGLGTGEVVAVEPAQARIHRGEWAPHLLGGLAPKGDPVALDPSVVHRFEGVDEKAAWEMAERLSRETGVLAGIVSGAILVAAVERARQLGRGAEVVAVLPDSGERRFMLAPFFADA